MSSKIITVSYPGVVQQLSTRLPCKPKYWYTETKCHNCARSGRKIDWVDFADRLVETGDCVCGLTSLKHKLVETKISVSFVVRHVIFNGTNEMSVPGGASGDSLTIHPNGYERF